MRVKKICKEQGFTIGELADRMQIARESLSRAINGNPTLETLEKIANALGVPVTELFERSSDEVIGAIRIGKDTHLINSKEDIKKLAKNL